MYEAFVWTKYVADSEGGLAPAVVLDYPQESHLDPNSFERTGQMVPVLLEVDGTVAGYRERVIPVPIIDTPGVVRFDGPPGTAPLRDSAIVMGRINAELSVMQQIMTGAAAGRTVIMWGYELPAEGEEAPRYEDMAQAPDYHPDGAFTTAQINSISAWLNANGITNVAFVEWLNNHLNTNLTLAQVADWMRTHRRSEFTDVIAEIWQNS